MQTIDLLWNACCNFVVYAQQITIKIETVFGNVKKINTKKQRLIIDRYIQSRP